MPTTLLHCAVLAVALVLFASCGSARTESPVVTAAPTPATAAAPADATVPAAPAATGPETSVRPGINDPYRAPDLDVERFDRNFSGESRETFAARHEVVRAMRLQRGDRVADIGAGTGIYVPLFADAVGPTGRVYAVDIAPQFLEWIGRRMTAAGHRHVTTQLGGDRSANLPDAGVDVIFHSDVYHHFEFPQSVNADLLRSLAPGGRMYVLDFERIEGVSSAWILGHVRAGKETVIREIESAGFEFVGEIELPELQQNYLLEFRKPG